MSDAILGVIIGGLIAILSSFLTFIISNYVPIIGKSRIYFLFKYDSEFNDIECKIEFLNTTNVTKIYRDINLYKFKDNKMMSKMDQASMSTTNRGGEVVDKTVYGNEGNYTVLLSNNSTKTIEGCFTSDIKDANFDSFYLNYYDEHDKIMVLKLCDKNNLDSVKGNWIKLNKCKCIKREIQNG